MRTRPKLGVVLKNGDIHQIVWKKGTPWWKKVPVVRVLQVIFGVATMVALILGMVFFTAKEWHASAISLAIAFFSIFVLWEIEHMECFYLRRDLAKMRTSANNEP